MAKEQHQQMDNSKFGKNSGAGSSSGQRWTSSSSTTSEMRSSSSSSSISTMSSPQSPQGWVKTSSGSVTDIILAWVQAHVNHYNNVQVTNFSTSWNDGLAFCALVHNFCPEAIDFDALDARNRRHNFELAFRAAEQYAGVYPLLDVEDMVRLKKPDWKSVFTYVQSLYHRFYGISLRREETATAAPSPSSFGELPGPVVRVTKHEYVLNAGKVVEPFQRFKNFEIKPLPKTNFGAAAAATTSAAPARNQKVQQQQQNQSRQCIQAGSSTNSFNNHYHANFLKGALPVTMPYQGQAIPLTPVFNQPPLQIHNRHASSSTNILTRHSFSVSAYQGAISTAQQQQFNQPPEAASPVTTFSGSSSSPVAPAMQKMLQSLDDLPPAPSVRPKTPSLSSSSSSEQQQQFFPTPPTSPLSRSLSRALSRTTSTESGSNTCDIQSPTQWVTRATPPLAPLPPLDHCRSEEVSTPPECWNNVRSKQQQQQDEGDVVQLLPITSRHETPPRGAVAATMPCISGCSPKSPIVWQARSSTPVLSTPAAQSEKEPAVSETGDDRTMRLRRQSSSSSSNHCKLPPPQIVDVFEVRVQESHIVPKASAAKVLLTRSTQTPAEPLRTIFTSVDYDDDEYNEDLKDDRRPDTPSSIPRPQTAPPPQQQHERDACFSPPMLHRSWAERYKRHKSLPPIPRARPPLTRPSLHGVM